MQVIFSFTSHDLQLSSWSWIFSYLKFNLSTIVSKPFVHSTVIPQFQHSALDSKPLETVLVLYMACPLCCVFRPALGCAQHLTQNEYSPHIPTKSSSSPTTRAFDPYVTQFSTNDFCGSFFVEQILPFKFCCLHFNQNYN